MPRRSLSRTGTFRAVSAPGKLRILQALVNTRDLEAGTDELDSPEALADWLARQGLVAPDTPVDEAAWRIALEIREALRVQFRIHNGAKVDGKPMAVLSRALGKAQTRLYLARDGTIVFEAAEAGWPGALARFLMLISDAKRTGRWTRLKACHSDTCQWIFYDGAKNRSGKWCTVRRCGNWANTETYRRRRPARERKQEEITRQARKDGLLT